MGAGKTAVGRALADRLRWAFVDTDEEVERAAGAPVERIFREHGEGRFRELEWQVLLGVAGATSTVVATGGGLFLAIAHRRRIRCSGTSAWLDVPLELVRARLDGDAARPLWRGRDQDALAMRALFERRRTTYALADLRIDASRGTVVEIARRMCEIPLISQRQR